MKSLQQFCKTENRITPEVREKANNTLARAGSKLLLSEPFYAHVLHLLAREITFEVPTAAVSIRGSRLSLLINPDFFESLPSDNQRMAVLKHELLHIILNHLFRPESRDPDSVPYLNIAADIVVNQYVSAKDLPKGAITLKTFPKLRLLPNKNLSYYIQELKKIAKVVLIKFAEDSPSDHSQWGQGNEGEGEGENIIAGLASGKSAIADHEKDAAQAAIGSKITQIIDEARQSGQLPSYLEEMISRETEQVSALSWKTVLRRFVHRTGRSSIKTTIKRVSKRYGTRPGIRVRRQLRLLVAIDTSGSVSHDMLKEFFDEIKAIGRLVTDIWIAECDTKVHRCYRHERGSPIKVVGRGGTRLDPVFEYINAQPGRFDAIIYLTDGFAPQPVIFPVKPTLLVINNHQHQLKPEKTISIINYDRIS